jgi:hypothetical protein
MHEEPIVCSPQDAVRAFLKSRLDYLALGPYLAVGPVGTAEIRLRYAGQVRSTPVQTAAVEEPALVALEERPESGD